MRKLTGVINTRQNKNPAIVLSIYEVIIVFMKILKAIHLKNIQMKLIRGKDLLSS